MDASQEYYCLRKDCPFIPDLELTCESTDLSITLLNIGSLRKHAIDISGDVRFHTDILSFAYRNISCLVRIFLKQRIPLIKFNKAYNDSIDKYQSISFCYTDSVVPLSHENELGVSVVVFNPFSTNVPLMQKPGSWFLLAKYLKNTCGRVTFCQ